MVLKEKLGNVCNILNGYAFKSGEYVEKGIRVIRINNVQKGVIEDFDSKYYPIEEEQNLKKYLLFENDLLISLTGNVGRVGLLKKEQLPAALNQRVGCLRVKDKKHLSIRYLFQLLNSNIFEFDCINNSKGIAQKNLSTEWLKGYEINIPNLDEQNKIAEKLEKVQKIVKLKKEQLNEFDNLIKSKFVEMFGSIKDTQYEIRTLEEIVDKNKKYSLKRGPFGGSLKKDDFVDSGYLVYEQRHAIHNDFEYEKYYINKEKYNSMDMFRVIPGDLIVSCSGVTLGRIAEIPKKAKEGIINQALLKISLDKEIMNNAFFIQQFRSDEIQNCLLGFSRGSGIPNFPSMNEVKKLKFICPNIKEQLKYENIVQQIDKQKVEIQNSLEEMQKLQESLMNKYFG